MTRRYRKLSQNKANTEALPPIAKAEIVLAQLQRQATGPGAILIPNHTFREILQVFSEAMNDISAPMVFP